MSIVSGLYNTIDSPPPFSIPVKQLRPSLHLPLDTSSKQPELRSDHWIPTYRFHGSPVDFHKSEQLETEKLVKYWPNDFELDGLVRTHSFSVNSSSFLTHALIVALPC